MEYLSKIDTLNRCYLWRVLFDHVRLLKISPLEFVTAVQSHLLAETEAQIIPYILERVCWILEHGILDNSSDKKFSEFAVKMAVEVLLSTISDKIRNLPDSKQSEKTLLMDYYVRIYPSDEEASFETLQRMAETGTCVNSDGKTVASLNKLQRYTCLRKCAASVQSADEASKIEALVEAERLVDASDVDKAEYMKYQGSRPLENEKMQHLNKMIDG